MGLTILHVIAELAPEKGGVGQAVRTQVKGLEDLGIFNEIVSLDGSDASFLGHESRIVHAMGPGKGPW